MKLNEKNVASFATCSSPIDKEGYLAKKGEFNKGYQRRWFVLKGNLLFYFEKKQDKEPLGLIVLEACSVQASPQAKHAFEISFDGPGTRLYLLMADNNEDMESWMKAISHAGYQYLRSIVDELQRRVNLLTSSSQAEQKTAASDMSLLHVGPALTASATPLLPSSGSTCTLPAPRSRLQRKASAGAENGILVDLSESQLSPPPVPRKKNSYTLAHNPQQAKGMHVRSSMTPPSSPTTTFSSSLSSSTSSQAARALRQTVQHVVSPAPHSSPYTLPARIDPAKPLSPASTLDRTQVLDPLPSGPSSDETVPMLPPKPADWASRVDSSTSPESHSTPPVERSSPQRGKQVAAALAADQKKTFYEMHEDFSRAISALRQDRNAGSAGKQS